jgi:hypothetical protein
MTKFSRVKAPFITLEEQASPPSTPDAGTQRLFIDSADGLPYLIDEADVVTPVDSGGGGGGGAVVQVVNTETGAVATGTTVIPFDDTIPQNTEGDQYMSLAITPTDAGNILLIDVVVQLSHSVAAWDAAALFQDSTANALAAIVAYQDLAGAGMTLHFRHKMTAGTTSATTFKVRAGGQAAGTTTFNGQAAGRIYGGVMASSITITEIAP